MPRPQGKEIKKSFASEAVAVLISDGMKEATGAKNAPTQKRYRRSKAKGELHYINLRVRGDLIPRAQEKAASMKISVNKYVEELIRKDLEM